MKRIATLLRDGMIVGLVHGPDAPDQQITVQGRVWRFDFDERLGPLWLRKDGVERKCQNPNKAVWAEWTKWHLRYRRRKAKASKLGEIAPGRRPAG